MNKYFIMNMLNKHSADLLSVYFILTFVMYKPTLNMI